MGPIVKLRSTMAQVRFSLQLKFNSLELDFEVGRPWTGSMLYTYKKVKVLKNKQTHVYAR